MCIECSQFLLNSESVPESSADVFFHFKLFEHCNMSIVFMCHLRGHLYSLTLARKENAFSVTSRDVIGPYYRLPVSSIFDKAHWTIIYNYYSSSMTRPIYCSFFVCNRAVRKTTKLHKMTKHYKLFLMQMPGLPCRLRSPTGQQVHQNWTGRFAHFKGTCQLPFNLGDIRSVCDRKSGLGSRAKFYFIFKYAICGLTYIRFLTIYTALLIILASSSFLTYIKLLLQRGPKK